MASSIDVLSLRVPGLDAVPLRYVAIGQDLFVVPTRSPGAWFAAAARDGFVEIDTGAGETSRRGASLCEGPDLMGRLRRRFDEKYGSEMWTRYFPEAQVALRLSPEGGFGARDDWVRIRGEFDAVAQDYDARVARQPLESYLKDRVASFAQSDLDGLDPILELGPGTGYHTLRLLAAGHRITAVDISSRMIDRLKRSAVESGVSARLATICGPARDLPGLLAGVPDGSFGGAFSAFGALDLERDLSEVVRGLARMIRPGGRLALTTLNRAAWSPVGWDLLQGRAASAAARLRPVIPAGGIRYPLTLYPRPPREWDRLLAGHFARVATQVVSVLAPPFDAQRLIGFLGPESRRKIQRVDRWLGRRALGAAAAEWLYLTYRRTSAGVQ
jgi:SAM-dependent methyltransferase